MWSIVKVGDKIVEWVDNKLIINVVYSDALERNTKQM